MTTFQAVWPIIDTAIPGGELIAEARLDIASVAARHHARLTGEPRFTIRPGHEVPGSRGAKYVILATAPAEEVPRRNYGWMGLGAAA